MRCAAEDWVWWRWLGAVLCCGAALAGLLVTREASGEEQDTVALPALVETDIALYYPGAPDAGTFHVTLFGPAPASPQSIAEARWALMARFPGAEEVQPGEVQAQFLTENVRWPERSATWLYNPFDATSRLSADQAYAAISSGAEGWTDAGGTGFHFDFAGYSGVPPGCHGIPGEVPADGLNVVGWGHISNGYWGFTCWWSASATVAGTSFQTMTEFDIVLEPDASVPYTPALLKALALHEFGHALGLAHAQEGLCPGVVMCAGTAATIQQRLTPDDIEGVRSLYGIAPTPTPTPTKSLPTPRGAFRSFAVAVARD